MSEIAVPNFSDKDPIVPKDKPAPKPKDAPIEARPMEDEVARPQAAEFGNDDVAKDLVVETSEVDPILKDLPVGNTYTQKYIELKEQIKQDPNMGGPFTSMLLSLYVMLAKYGKYAELMPGKFMESVTTDPEQQAKQLTEEEEKKLLAGNSNPDAKKNAQDLLKVIDEKDPGSQAEKASVKYLCEHLWGISTIEDPKTLSAKLLNAGQPILTPDFANASLIEERIPYYESVPPMRLQKDGLTKGTILVFVGDYKTATKLVAHATDKNKIEYFDPDKKEMVESDFTGKNSPIKVGFGLLAAFAPNQKLVETIQTQVANVDGYLSQLPANDPDDNVMHIAALNRINLAKNVGSLAETLNKDFLSEELKASIKEKIEKTARDLEAFVITYRQLQAATQNNIKTLKTEYISGKGEQKDGEDVASKLTEEEKKMADSSQNINLTELEEQIKKLNSFIKV